jgi:hypothetical protein
MNEAQQKGGKEQRPKKFSQAYKKYVVRVEQYSD